MNKKLIIILFLALILRLISLNQSLWLDEATTALVSQMSIAQYLREFAPADFHPPLYYLLLMELSRLLGNSEVALRSLSVVSGVGIVWLVYLIGKSVADKKIGTISALFAATSGLLIYYSQEARMYGLAAFFVTLSIYVFLKSVRSRGYWWWMAFGVSMSAALLTHYLTIFAVPIFWLWAILDKRDKRFWKGFLVSWLVPFIAFAVWLPKFMGQFAAGRSVQGTTPLWWNILGRTTLKEIGLVPTKFMFGRISFEDPLNYGLLVLVAGIGFLFLLIKTFGGFGEFREKIASKEGLIWMWLVVPVTLSAIFGLWIPVFSYFRLLYALPALYILLAIGVSKLEKHFGVAIAFILVVNLMSSGMYLFNDRFHREDWRGLVEYIEDNSSGDSVTIFVADSQMEAFDYYLNDLNRFGPDDVSNKYDTVWLMRYVQDVFDPEDLTRKLVEESYNKVSEHDFNGVVVWKYENRN